MKKRTIICFSCGKVIRECTERCEEQPTCETIRAFQNAEKIPCQWCPECEMTEFGSIDPK